MIAFAYLLEAVRHSSSDLVPVHTILPELNTSAVDFGSLILIMAAANLLGLYSQFLTFNAIDLRSNLAPKLQVATKFCRVGSLTDYWTMQV